MIKFRSKLYWKAIFKKMKIAKMKYPKPHKTFAGMVLVFLCLLFLKAYYREFEYPISAIKNFSKESAFSDDAENKATFYVRSAMDNCFKKGGGADACYKKIARVLSDEFSLEFILHILQANENYEAVFSRCHEVTHFLAREAYKKTKNAAETYSKCTPVCHGGCYHGVLEGYFEEKNIQYADFPDEILKQEVIRICGKSTKHTSPRIFHECLHGIGHALMFITESNLFRSLTFCDALPAQVERESCYGGVFMENSSSSTNQDHPASYLKSDDPLYPCTVLSEHYLETCYKYQSSYFAELTHWDWQKTIELCRKVPSQYQKGCFFIIGSNQVGYSQDLNVAVHTCRLIQNEQLQKECVKGVASSLGGRYVNEPFRILDFCVMVDKDYKDVCYQEIDNALISWGENPIAYKERNMCPKASDPYTLAWCKEIE